MSNLYAQFDVLGLSPPEVQHLVAQLELKTIARVSNPGCVERADMLIEFTDGSKLSLIANGWEIEGIDARLETP